MWIKVAFLLLLICAHLAANRACYNTHGVLFYLKFGNGGGRFWVWHGFAEPESWEPGPGDGFCFGGEIHTAPVGHSETAQAHKVTNAFNLPKMVNHHSYHCPYRGLYLFATKSYFWLLLTKALSFIIHCCQNLIINVLTSARGVHSLQFKTCSVVKLTIISRLTLFFSFKRSCPYIMLCNRI